MATFVLGLVIGVALGLVVIGSLAVGSFERGRDFWLRFPAPISHSLYGQISDGANFAL